MKILTLIAAVCLLAMAQVALADWTENWDNYTSGATPYDGWFLGTGTWSGLTGGQVKSPEQSYRVTAGQISRIGRAIGAPLVGATSASVSGWLYDYNGGTTMKRSLLGFQNYSGTTINVNNALVRMGCLNSANYIVQYWNGALVTVQTGLANETGWHYMSLTVTDVGAGNWRCDWRIDNAAGTQSYTGNFTWAFAAASANGIVLGYNYSNSGAEVDWDNIGVSIIPEAGSLAALATGLVGLVGFVRRRR